MLMATALSSSRIEARIAIAGVDTIKAHEAARAGLEIAAFRAAKSKTDGRQDALSQTLSLNGYDISIQPALEHFKLDLNLTSEITLVQFFLMLGIELDHAQSLAAKIADWRDEDDLSRVNGAERIEYLNSDFNVENRSFRSVNELMKVIDMTLPIYMCASPALTVLGDAPVPDSKWLYEIYGRNFDGPQSTKKASLATSGRGMAGGRRIALTAIATSKSGRRYALSGLIRITGGTEPYEFIAIYPEHEFRSTPDCSHLFDDT